MIDDVNGVVFAVFIFLFLLVTVLGFAAARWRRAKSLDSLDEWGLGGRGFGTFIAWFLIGGDIYTAYTFIAVPATLYAGSAVGFFAVPYTIVVYPLIFLFLPRLWSVSHRHGYVTPADFVEGRYDSRPLALAVAVTGILATMPYIALQLVGMQVVLEVMGIGTNSSNWFIKDIPLFLAFIVLAAYTYSSGLRAPALIAFVKDTLIYIVIIVAVLYLPSQLGGWDSIFSTANDSFTAFNKENADAIAAGDAAPKAMIPPATAQWAYASLALGSALALFMYPHSVTGVLSTRSRSVIRRNAALLPAYSFLLGLLALLGFVAIAAGVKVGEPAAVGAAAVRERVLAVVRRRRLRGDRDRCPGAGGDHVDRGREPVDPQHLQGVHQPRRHAPAGGQAGQAGLAGGEVRRAGLRARAVEGLRDQPAAARRRLDPADHARDRHRPLHPVDAPLGADGRLGGRDGLRHLARVRREVARAGPLRRSAGELPRHRDEGLHRPDRLPAQPLVAVVLTVVFRAMKVDEGVDQTRPQDYHADAGDPGVEEELDPEAPAHA